MGGARCSYRNCTQRSDKQTHLFHYPVFDKLRCHQWIINAQKLNYLDLKLSQLKNRMVCEHHFTDDCFMNEMKQKLKSTAIPTLDGPFCPKLEKEEEANLARIYKDIAMPINIDDIENEVMPRTEKKAHLSVKYGDFLTNDISEEISLTPSYKPSSVIIQDDGILFNRYEIPKQIFCTKLSGNSNIKAIARLTRENKVKSKDARMDEAVTFQTNLPNPKVVPIDLDEFNLTTPQNQNKSTASDPLIQQTKNITGSKTFNAIPHTKKVRIISEKHISEPVQISGELQPVSPSIVIQVPDKKSKSNIVIDGRDVLKLYVDESENFTAMKNEDFSSIVYTHEPKLSSVIEDNVNSYQPTIIDKRHSNAETENVVSLFDNKSTEHLPSGVYNSMQIEQGKGLENIDMSTGPNVEFVSCSTTGPSVFTLTDLPPFSTAVKEISYVENPSTQNALLSSEPEIMSTNREQAFCMPVAGNKTNTASKNLPPLKKVTPKPSSPSKVTRKLPPEKLAAIEEKRKYNMKLRDILNSCLNNMDEEPDLGKLTAAMKKEISTKKVGEHLYPDSSSKSNLPEPQENIIGYLEARLQRMEDNLLNKIEQNSQKILELKSVCRKPVKKSTFTQTYLNAEQLKKSLYQQVSKYLSPDMNSKIYEELFINQCLSKTVTKKDVTNRKRKRTSIDNEL